MGEQEEESRNKNEQVFNKILFFRRLELFKSVS